MSSFVLSSTNAAGIPDEQWIQPAGAGNQIGITFEENAELLRQNTRMIGSFLTSPFERTCTSVKDPTCSDATGLVYFAYLQPCMTSSQTDCIDSVWAVKPDGTKVAGTYSQTIPSKSIAPYSTEGAKGLHPSGDPTIWKIAGISNGGGEDLYSINAQIKGGSTTPDLTNFGTGGHLEVGIYPVSIKTGAYGNTGNWFTSGIDNRNCASAGEEKCSLRQSFPEGVRFGVKARVGWNTSGWIHGRINEPLASFSTDGNQSVLSVEALPVKVPVVSVWADKSALDSELTALYVNGGNKTDPRTSGRGGIGSSDGKGNLSNSVNVAGGNAELLLWLKLANDKAVVTPSYWSFKSMGPWAADNTTQAGQNLYKCVYANPGLSAVLGTNATTYMEGAPGIDADGNLTYKVAAPHFNADGSVFTGTYDLVIDSKVARCIYGFTNAPISASVSVVSATGENQVVTTIVKEDKGFLVLSAKGFTFSNPTIKVKLTQEKSVVAPAPVETKAPVIKKTTITCVKGKTTKKVTAVKPVCPKGYKKK